MPILPIVHYPEAVLLEVGKPVDEFGGELESLVADMFVTMKDAGGVGLAAPQVGVGRRLFVMDTPERDGYAQERHVLINPEIIHVEDEQTGDEGCLSFPGLDFLSCVVHWFAPMFICFRPLRGLECR